MSELSDVVNTYRNVRTPPKPGERPEMLAFYDAADAVEVSAALTFDIVFVFGLAAEPEDNADQGQHCDSR